MAEYVRATVSGVVPVRDALTRESVEPGGTVVLLVRKPGETRPRCPRHPKRNVNNVKQRCLCGGTVIEWLVEQGMVADVKPFDPDKSAKAEPAEKPKA